jgi:hypothetical protein
MGDLLPGDGETTHSFRIPVESHGYIKAGSVNPGADIECPDKCGLILAISSTYVSEQEYRRTI